jgi:ABC-type multidrug transport system fused ATPase/permease subunit
MIIALYKILPKNLKILFIKNFFLNFSYSVVEIASLSTIPILLIILSENLYFLKDFFIRKNIYFLYLYLNKFDYTNLILFLILFILFIFFFKNIFYLFAKYRDEQLIKKISLDFTTKLYESYIDSDFLYFIKQKQSGLITNINTDIKRILNAYTSAFTIIKDFILIIFIFFLLSFSVDDFFYLLLALIILMIFVFIFYINLKKKIITVSSKELLVREKFTKIFMNSISNYVSLKASNIQKFVLNDFISANKKSLNYILIKNMYSAIPRPLVELIGIIVLVLILIIQLKVFQTNTAELLAKLSIFFICFLRLIPAFTSISTSFINLKFSFPSVLLIKNQIKTFKNNAKVGYSLKIKDFKNDFLASLNEVSFAYDNKNFIINNIKCNIEKNDYLKVNGKSGSGKSTLVLLIMGLLSPTNGEILINQRKWVEKNFFSYLSQRTAIFEGTILQNIILGSEKIDNTRLENALEISMVNEFLPNLRDGINTSLNNQGFTVSGGQMQRIAMARAIYSQASILIIDEALGQINQDFQNKILKTLKNKNIFEAVICISHNKLDEKIFNKSIDL